MDARGRLSRSGFVLVLFFALIQSTAHAQGTIHGVVKDETGTAHLPGVTVEIKSKALQRNLASSATSPSDWELIASRGTTAKPRRTAADSRSPSSSPSVR